jgi:thiamine biosynthesis lipoprotein
MPPRPIARPGPAPTAAPYARATIRMDTLITIQAPRLTPADDGAAAVERALAWFGRVEAVCSRFDPGSELARLTRRVGAPTPVSDLLYQALAVALAVARASGGAFDPTIGHRLERRGFDRNYLTGETVASPVAFDNWPSYRDVRLDPARRAVTLRRPLALDLGAVAKGLAIDLAARELAPLGDFAIDAGGDLYLGGRNADGEPWRVGVRHPRRPGDLLATLRVTDRAVCTSGDYERRAPDPVGGHHLIDPRSGRSPAALASVTVVAPTAMAADALATAAFVLGPRRGRRLLERQGVDGLLVTPALDELATPDFARYRA